MQVGLLNHGIDTTSICFIELPSIVIYVHYNNRSSRKMNKLLRDLFLLLFMCIFPPDWWLFFIFSK
jgi:hypothetical protein